jgi:hypothetical protein
MAVTRRTFLLGTASALVLAACGGDDDDSGTAGESSSTSEATSAAGGLAIARVFSPVQPGGAPLRLPIALADAEGALLDSVPTSIKARYGLQSGTDRTDFVDVDRHAEGIPTPYFPLVVDFPDLGTYQIEIEADGKQAATTVDIVEPTKTAVVPGPGAPLVALQTPTTTDARGVKPICTRDPVCPFHDQTLEEAMASGKAVAFIISTPQFCQTAICGPVLDLLIDRAEQHREVVAFVHAEVYTDDTAKETTEAVKAYGLTWEPSLFLAMPDGTITSRLDYTYDGVELDKALSTLVQ